MMRQLLILGVAVLMAASLAACGRKGNPEVPEDTVYPRNYPYTPFPAQPTATKKKPSSPAGDATEEEPFQAPQPRRTRPDELKPPAGNPETGRPQ